MNHPQKTHKLQTGQVVGYFTLIQKIPYNKNLASNMRLRWRVQCVCGNRETLPEYYMLRDHSPKKHCGCKNKSLFTHNPQEYRIWMMMHVRCEDPRHEAYIHYGGRGIKVCAEWHKSRGIDGFKAFLEYVGKRPSPTHTIDRIDNNLGYQPFQADGVTRQLRWATPEQQRANQRTPEQAAQDRAAYAAKTNAV